MPIDATTIDVEPVPADIPRWWAIERTEIDFPRHPTLAAAILESESHSRAVRHYANGRAISAIVHGPFDSAELASECVRGDQSHADFCARPDVATATADVVDQPREEPR